MHIQPLPPHEALAQAHVRESGHVAEVLGVDPAQGLDERDAAQRQALHGLNCLPAPPPPSWARRLLGPLREFMSLVLLAAAGLAWGMGDPADAAVIALIVALNAGISAWQSWRADSALAALAPLAESPALVRRAGNIQRVANAQLVPGDVVLLEAGQRVPADVRLHEVAQLRVDESPLTGESVSMPKHNQALGASASPSRADHAARASQPELPVADRHNMAWKGTLITQGRAEGLVVATGAHTQLGQIADMLAHAGPPPPTPLQQRLQGLGQRLSAAALAIGLLVFALGWWRGEALGPLALTALSLAVAALPEALPAVVAVVLALGAARLAQVQALVRRLPAVETLGSVTVICSDKTGTLTQNRMRVEATWHLGPSARPLWDAAVLCNDAQETSSGWEGDPTETALTEAAEHAGVAVDTLRSLHPRTAEWPFDAERKRMATLHGDWLIVKGAPEAVLPRCTRGAPHDAALKTSPAAWHPDEVLHQAQVLAERGLRVLAVAERRDSTLATPATRSATTSPPTLPSADDIEQDLAFVGLIGLIDPPRPEAAAAVADCRRAGIRPVMITGDHPMTALAIARTLGIADADTRAITGAELAQMDDAALDAALPRASRSAIVASTAAMPVFARMDPRQKIRIVQALQAQGEVVAMTGDGVNDAPSLQRADIGVAMGRNGTDVARESAGLVLLDDHFATIVAAVREGRRIFDNIRKFVRYVLTGNAAEVLLLVLAPLLGLPLPLLPIQILWINLVTDGLPGLALAGEPAEADVMGRPPRPASEGVMTPALWWQSLRIACVIAGLCLGLQAWAWHSLDHSNGLIDAAHSQTLVFTAMTWGQMALILALRADRHPPWRADTAHRRNPALLAAVALTVLLQLALVYVPVLQTWFHTHALSAMELVLCAGVAFGVWLWVIAEKRWGTRLNGAPNEHST